MAKKTDVIIIGAGPAGLFAALVLIENGIKPIRCISEILIYSVQFQ